MMKSGTPPQSMFSSNCSISLGSALRNAISLGGLRYLSIQEYLSPSKISTCKRMNKSMMYETCEFKIKLSY